MGSYKFNPFISNFDLAGTSTLDTTTPTSFTEGSVIFIGSDTTLQEDNANLFFDDTNDYVGIGTNVPDSHLHVLVGATNKKGIHIQGLAGQTVSLFSIDLDYDDGFIHFGDGQDGSSVVFNEGAQDIDFRVESTSNANVFFLDGGTSRVGFNTNEPVSTLDVRGTFTLTTSDKTITDGEILGQLSFQAPVESSGGDAILVAASIWAEADATFDATTNKTDLVFATGESETATEKMRLTWEGNLGIGTATPTELFDVSNGKMYLNTTDVAGQSLTIETIEFEHSAGLKTNQVLFTNDSAWRVNQSLFVFDCKVSVGSGGFNLFDLRSAGVSKFVVTSTGAVAFKDDVSVVGSYWARNEAGNLGLHFAQEGASSANVGGIFASGSTPSAGVQIFGSFWNGDYCFFNKGNVHIGSSADPSAMFKITSDTTTEVVSIFKGAASQTADLSQWQNSSGAVLAWVSKDGNLFLDGTDPAYSTFNGSEIILDGNTGDTERVVFGAYNVSGGTWAYFGNNMTVGNTFDRTNASKEAWGFILDGRTPESAFKVAYVGGGGASATSKIAVRPDGSFLVGDDIGPNPDSTKAAILYFDGDTSRLGINTSGNPGAMIHAIAVNATDVGQIIKGAVSQTANLLETQDSSGTIDFAVTPGGTNEATVEIINPGGTGPGAWNAALELRAQSNKYPSIYFTQQSTTQRGMFVSCSDALNANNNTRWGQWGFVPTSATASELRFQMNETKGTTNPRSCLVIASSGTVTVEGFIASAVGQIIKAAGSQSANLTEWQDSSGTLLTNITASGEVGIGATPPRYPLHVQRDGTAGNIPIIECNWATSTSASEGGIVFYQGATFMGAVEIFGSAYTTTLWRDAFLMTAANNNLGKIIFRTKTGGSYKERMLINNAGLVGINDTAPAAQLDINTSGSTIIGQIIKASASQSANLTEWQDNSATVMLSVQADGDLEFNDGVDIIFDTTTGSMIGTATSQKLGFYGVTPIVQPTEITDELTTITHTAPGTPDYAIQNFTVGGYGFVTADEGNTVLSVIANLQARVNELETTLSSLGLLADAD